MVSVSVSVFISAKTRGIKAYIRAGQTREAQNNKKESKKKSREGRVVTSIEAPYSQARTPGKDLTGTKAHSHPQTAHHIDSTDSTSSSHAVV